MRKLILACLVMGMCAGGAAQETKVVKVKKAGTLAELLTDEEKTSVEDLAIEGKLNSSDIVLLRKMAGAKNKKEANPWAGRLKRLDLSKANFENDKTPYYTSPVGKNYKITWTLNDNLVLHNRRTGTVTAKSKEQYLDERERRRERVNDVTKGNRNSLLDNQGKRTFVIGQLTDKEWTEMKRHGWNELPDNFISREEGDTVYYINCHTAKNWISSYMFYKCTKLETVVLNEHTECISSNAFAGCKSLREIVIPKRVDKIKPSAFRRTPSLHKVSISQHPEMELLKLDDAAVIQRFFKDSSPELEIVRY